MRNRTVGFALAYMVFYNDNQHSNKMLSFLSIVQNGPRTNKPREEEMVRSKY